MNKLIVWSLVKQSFLGDGYAAIITQKEQFLGGKDEKTFGEEEFITRSVV